MSAMDSSMGDDMVQAVASSEANDARQAHPRTIRCVDAPPSPTAFLRRLRRFEVRDAGHAGHRQVMASTIKDVCDDLEVRGIAPHCATASTMRAALWRTTAATHDGAHAHRLLALLGARPPLS